MLAIFFASPVWREDTIRGVPGRESLSVGFTFAWYRIAIVVPESVGGVALAGSRVWFETNADNYGEIWIDGKPRDSPRERIAAAKPPLERRRSVR